MKAIAWAFVCILAATLCSGQDFPKAEVYGGYSYVNIDTNSLTSRQSANGWETSVSGSFNKWFAVEGDVSGYYKTYAINLSPGLGTIDVRVTDYSFAGGPRFNVRPLFIHALIGGDHLSGSAAGYSASQDGLAGAFGGGIEWPVAHHLAVRASVDYAFSRHNIFGAQSYTQNNVRAGAGLVYTFGTQGVSHQEKAAPTPQPSQSGLPIPQLGIVAIATESHGAEIREIAPGSIAELAGLRVGDIINGVDGKSIGAPSELEAELSARNPGAKVKLAFMVRGYWQSETVLILK